ncbi:MAG TPA: PQQ-dependent sugar dehydrogenase [Rhizomicrobium sp.]|nr:PQQ-dependent sugar dehydrogenase [Rhizomicrobium sp.]
MTKLLPLLAGLLALAAGTAFAADTPGQHFAISPTNLVRPGATPAVDNSSQVVPRPANAMPEAPKGFTVSLFASDLTHPRFIAVAPNGDVFVSESDASKITVLADRGGVQKRATFASGFKEPHGLAFHDGALYVADQVAVWKLGYKDGALKAGPKTRISTGSFGVLGGHFTRDIAFDKDGTLYLAIGSLGNVDENPLPRAAVSIVDASGKLQPFASGLRNPVGIAVYPGTNNVFVTVNERDGLGDDLPPDYFTRIQRGDFFGWPYAYIGPHPDPDFGKKRPDLVAKTKTPDLLFQAHSAPLGVVFYDGSQFPAEFKGDAFVALHGSWNSAKPTGYKVVRVHFQNGKPAGGYDNFLTGFHVDNTSPAQVWGRPVGLAVAKDGSLLVTDDAGKAVWRVAYTRK